MATTLLGDAARANDNEFKLRVRSAIFRVLPDIIGEDATAAGTEAMRVKRHALAMRILAEPNYWVTRMAMLIVGETAVFNTDDSPGSAPGSAVTDTVIKNKVNQLYNDLAGVEIGDMP